MKGTLEFDLYEEFEEFKNAQNGGLYKTCLQEIDNKLRAMDKYDQCSEITIEHARSIIYETCEDYGVKIFGE